MDVFVNMLIKQTILLMLIILFMVLIVLIKIIDICATFVSFQHFRSSLAANWFFLKNWTNNLKQITARTQKPRLGYGIFGPPSRKFYSKRKFSICALVRCHFKIFQFLLHPTDDMNELKFDERTRKSGHGRTKIWWTH